MSDARYAVGIDLGTTHCALSYVDLDASEWDEVTQDLMPVPQLTGPGTVAALPLLPSFLYLPHPDEFAVEDLTLPWDDRTDQLLGELARSVGARTPIRLVSSAKSWLCHPGIDRRSSVLPPGAPEDEVSRVSPYQASVRYLEHLRDAWNHAHPEHDLVRQEVTVTVPASFDPAARELTAEAAQTVGFQHLVLLEEPQAALYSWIHDSAGTWRKQVRVGDIILVIDVGGGTTDLSLIAVTARDGALELVRVAVGEHILLGGDNMDLALAHLVGGKLTATGTTLDHWQIQALTHGCRQAKEALLMDPSLEAVPVVVPSRGTRLIRRSLRTELTGEEVTHTLVEGFFPEVPVSARPAARPRAALTKLGLPYAQDAAVTRHLAAFLGMQKGATEDLPGFEPGGGSFLHPTAVLFNGGVFKANLLVERVIKVINDWLATDDAPRPVCSRESTSTSPWRAGPPTTATSGAGVGSESGAVPPAPTMWAWRAPCPPCQAWNRGSRPCAWPPSAWKKAAKPKSRPRNSAWSSPNKCGFGSSAPRCGATIRSETCSKIGPPKKSKSSRKSRPTSPRKRERQGNRPGTPTRLGHRSRHPPARSHAPRRSRALESRIQRAQPRERMNL